MATLHTVKSKYLEFLRCNIAFRPSSDTNHLLFKYFERLLVIHLTKIRSRNDSLVAPDTNSLFYQSLLVTLTYIVQSCFPSTTMRASKMQQRLKALPYDNITFANIMLKEFLQLCLSYFLEFRNSVLRIVIATFPGAFHSGTYENF